MERRRHIVRWFTLAALTALPSLASATALEPLGTIPAPLAALQMQFSHLSAHAPGHVGIAVEDLATGLTTGVDGGADLPAASTIKIPVMVEVFKQLEAGRIALTTPVRLQQRDRDWGWGDLADAPGGTIRNVKELLWLMITQSDNTATNMLIRTVGRGAINATMAGLGLHRTHLAADIRSESESIRYGLRTSPSDMVALLDKIARDRCVDEWSSREMLAILAGQTHNGLLPMPLPKDVRIAHKTGSLHDTLNDVGIVYELNEPYVIAVMTTQLPELGLGRAFIHRVSRAAYSGFARLAQWREDAGIAAFSPAAEPLAARLTSNALLSPDVPMWTQQDAEPAAIPISQPLDAPVDSATPGSDER